MKNNDQHYSNTAQWRQRSQIRPSCFAHDN